MCGLELSSILLFNKDIIVFHTIPLLVACFVFWRMWYLRHKVVCVNCIIAGMVLSTLYILLQIDWVVIAFHEYLQYEYAPVNDVLFSLWEATVMLAYERAVSFCVRHNSSDVMSPCECARKKAKSDEATEGVVDSILTYNPVTKEVEEQYLYKDKT